MLTLGKQYCQDDIGENDKGRCVCFRSALKRNAVRLCLRSKSLHKHHVYKLYDRRFWNKFIIATTLASNKQTQLLRLC